MNNSRNINFNETYDDEGEYRPITEFLINKDRVILRPPVNGEYGWVIQQHGEIYWKEYNYNENFEAKIASIVCDFINNRNSPKYGMWIAELNGVRVGSVACAQENETTAKLRLLIVTPEARGLGLGMRLVQHCLKFAKSVGYLRIRLGTNNILPEAAHIYEKIGFKMVEIMPENIFGRSTELQILELLVDLIGQPHMSNGPNYPSNWNDYPYHGFTLSNPESCTTIS